MTSKERLFAILDGRPVDQRPRISLGHASNTCDAWAVPLADLDKHVNEEQTYGIFALIDSPITKSIERNMDVFQTLQKDPHAGNQILQSLVEETEREVRIALDSGVFGILYRIEGAHPNFCTPMQYGGHFLELDRQILETAQRATCSAIWIEGGPDAYLDSVTDLPTTILGFRSGSGDLNWIRQVRKGLIAMDGHEGDIEIVTLTLNSSLDGDWNEPNEVII